MHPLIFGSTYIQPRRASDYHGAPAYIYIYDPPGTVSNVTIIAWPDVQSPKVPVHPCMVHAVTGRGRSFNWQCIIYACTSNWLPRCVQDLVAS